MEVPHSTHALVNWSLLSFTNTTRNLSTALEIASDGGAHNHYHSTPLFLLSLYPTLDFPKCRHNPLFQNQTSRNLEVQSEIKCSRVVISNGDNRAVFPYHMRYVMVTRKHEERWLKDNLPTEPRDALVVVATFGDKDEVKKPREYTRLR